MVGKKGETLYYTESTWLGMSGETGRLYNTYRRVSEDEFRRISERDDAAPFESLRSLGTYKLAIDLGSGNIYERAGSVQEKDWALRRFGDAVGEGIGYERLDSALVDEAWLKHNALDVVHALLKNKAR